MGSILRFNGEKKRAYKNPLLLFFVIVALVLFGLKTDVIGAEETNRKVIQATGESSELVKPTENNTLAYQPYNNYGDMLGDYSFAGFYGGKYELPETKELDVAARISPTETSEDDRERIQAIIDNVAETVGHDEMKIVKLNVGVYNISKPGIKIPTGILLEGSGQGPDGTILRAMDREGYSVVDIKGVKPTAAAGSEVKITDTYVAAAMKTVTVEDSSRFNVGDLIAIRTTSPQTWLQAMEMDQVTGKNNDDISWYEGRANTESERRILKIEGNKITLDNGLYVPVDNEKAQSFAYKIDDSKRINNFGVENLRIDTVNNGGYDENHAENGIRIQYARDGFVRDVTVKNVTKSAVICDYGAKQISVVNCSCLEPVSKIEGSRRYAFACSHGAQQVLFYGCYSEKGRHDYMASFPTGGPAVFLDSVADNSYYSSETHGIWSTGILYDNIYEVGKERVGFIALANRGSEGSQTTKSQGWTTAGSVAWNCLSPTILVQKPLMNYQNFAIGAWGNYPELTVYPKPLSKIILEALFGNKSKKSVQIYEYTEEYRTRTVTTRPAVNSSYYSTVDGISHAGDAYKEASDKTVEPRSLFKAQLADRIKGDIRKTVPNAPIITGPAADKTQADGTVKVSGYYQKGAGEVTVFIDGAPHQADLSNDDNTFSVNAELQDGWHRIYAVQKINGKKSAKTADRFVKTGSGLGAPQESNYRREDYGLIENDDRPSFDELKNKYSIEGMAFEDIDADGLYSEDKDNILENIPVKLYEIREGETKFKGETTTNGHGSYVFGKLAAGSYKVEMTNPDNEEYRFTKNIEDTTANYKVNSDVQPEEDHKTASADLSLPVQGSMEDRSKHINGGMQKKIEIRIENSDPEKGSINDSRESLVEIKRIWPGDKIPEPTITPFDENEFDHWLKDGEEFSFEDEIMEACTVTGIWKEKGDDSGDNNNGEGGDQKEEGENDNNSEQQGGQRTLTSDLPEIQKPNTLPTLREVTELNKTASEKDNAPFTYKEAKKQIPNEVTPGTPAPTKAVEAVITGAKNDGDIKGSTYAPLKLLSRKQTGNSIELRWSKVKGTTKYTLYGNLCGKGKKYHKIKSLKGMKVNLKKIAGKKVRKGASYKFIIIAEKGNWTTAISGTMHVRAKGDKKYDNYKSVGVGKNVIACGRKLKKGKSLALKAKGVAPKGKKVQQHVRIRYESSSKKIAVVSKNGRVKARKKGSCYVYCYAQNGVAKKVKIRVK